VFKVTKEMIEQWEKDNQPRAGAADISKIEDYIQTSLPVPYVEFVTRFGFVMFGREPEGRDCFDYFINYPDRKEVREGDISHFKDPEPLIETHEVLTSSEDDSDDEFPKFPAQFLPIGMDAGQGEILLELGEDAGRVWYWPFDEWAWGKESNTTLGFVAENLYDFINGLRPMKD
jgi:hypothetical protein